MKTLHYLAVLVFVLSFPIIARADSLNVLIQGSLPGGGSLIDSTFTVDTTSGTVTGVDFDVSYGGSSYLFNTVDYQTSFDGEYYFTSEDAAGDLLLVSTPGSFVGFTGEGELCSTDSPCSAYSSFLNIPGDSGPVVFDQIGNAPEPSSLVLLGTGVLGIVGAARRRFVRA